MLKKKKKNLNWKNTTAADLRSDYRGINEDLHLTMVGKKTSELGRNKSA